jgi:hypothetical protein
MGRALDVVFVLNSLVYFFSAVICLWTPHWLDKFLKHGTQPLSEANESEEFLWPADKKQMHYQLHVFVRLYGTMMLMQAWQVWRNRLVTDAFVRRTCVQSYFLQTSVTAGLLGYGQWTTQHFHDSNWFNVFAFGTLAGIYGYFLLVLPMPAFNSGNSIKGV